MTDSNKPAPQLDHPCRQTCSGWKQGYERGLSELKAERDEAINQWKLHCNDADRYASEMLEARAEVERLRAALERIARLDFKYEIEGDAKIAREALGGK